MLKIGEIQIENRKRSSITDNLHPKLSFSLESDIPDTCLSSATIIIGNYEQTVFTQTGIMLEDLSLAPFTEYELELIASDNHGNIATKKATFSTARMGTEWSAHWITDKDYKFANKTSPLPMTFRKSFNTEKAIKRAYVMSTAIGVYELEINGKKVGNEYFAPGFTSYRNWLQYQYYDVTELLAKQNTIIAVVGGGWAVGRFTFEITSKITADRQAFLMELFVEYVDGSKEKIITDNTWQVCEKGNFLFGDFYDGEYYDATIDLQKIQWKTASVIKPKIKPELTVQSGGGVIAHEALLPVKSFPAANGRETIYDFGQNFAGVVNLKIQGKQGQKIIIRHAEVLHNGDLCVKSLRTAKATATYICVDGEQTYSPRLTYMGFRYIAIEGIDNADIEVSAFALYSDFDEIGLFSCSDARLNKLQSNIAWGGKSNLIDIPTDCPQRDERQGWTGDIAIFSSTACFNFNLNGFFEKWLKDLRVEQGRGGGIPFVIPKHGHTAPTMAIACWGDSCVLVPWAEYLSRGDIGLLRKQYPSMKKYLKAVKFWTGFLTVGKTNRRIWKWPFQYGDWCAPEGEVKDWIKRGKWIATAYYANSCSIVAKIADILQLPKEKKRYLKLHNEICQAYRKVFTDRNGKLKNEFQTGYVLPLHFDMFKGKERELAAANLNRLVADNNYRLNTGFTGTPYLLFALADNGYSDTAYKLLLQEECPSWLYGIKMGATTFWEKWDAILPGGSIKNLEGGEVPSFNHYAYGAVGDFLYRRVVGLEATSGGYKTFRIKPVLGGNLTFAECKTECTYGKIAVKWEIKEDVFTLNCTVPVSCECEAVLPNGKIVLLKSGSHTLKEAIGG